MNDPERPLRFGLVGTGYWARVTHAPALASAEGIDFTAVWGRTRGSAAKLAAEHQATAHTDIDAFLADVDGVAFAVPPDVQAEIAVLAANAGKHLLLEKPIAISADAADALARAVENARVASVVFFTARFQANVRAWLADVTRAGGWVAGTRSGSPPRCVAPVPSTPRGDGTRAAFGTWGRTPFRCSHRPPIPLPGPGECRAHRCHAQAVAGEIAAATAEPVLVLRNVRLTQAQAQCLARRLTDLADGLEDAGDGESRYGLLLGLYLRQPGPTPT